MYTNRTRRRIEFETLNVNFPFCFTLGFLTNGKSEDNLQQYETLKKERRSLPIYPARQNIIIQIKRLPSVIIIGETGSGKTTQIPQVILMNMK